MMRTQDGKIEDLKIAYIGGGSRGWAWGFMMDIAMDGQICGTVCLYDIDHKAAERNRIIGEKISNHPDAQSPWAYQVSPTLQNALTGADFVVISILPGTFEEMRADVHTPEQYGIFQSVGDTVGPGGFMRSLRAIPMFVEIAEAIRKYAPEAWVINYTNPMSLCLRALYEAFPDIKAFGCCHEVFGTQKLLCAMLEQQEGILGVKRQDLHTTVTGINHFTWMIAANYQGMDLLPLYQRFVHTHYETGFEEGGDDNWMNSSFHSAQRVKFDLFRKYGVIAAAGDRHLAEFMPPWYLKDPKTVKQWKFGLTTVDWRVSDLAAKLKRSVDLISGAAPLNLKPSGEEGHLLIKALLGLSDMISNVNLPNRGQVPNLPMGPIVETNAFFKRNSVEAIPAGNLPGNILPLVARHVYNQENILRCALSCDRKLAFTTFMNDPLVTIGPEEGSTLFDQMLEGQKKYLPSQWFA